MGKFTKTVKIDIDLTRDDVEEYLKDAIEYRKDFDEFSKLTGIIDIICNDDFKYEDGIDMIEKHFADIIKRARGLNSFKNN
jgi:hypothetical protein